MTEQEKKAFLGAYALNIAAIPNDQAEILLDAFLNGSYALKLTPEKEAFIDALIMWTKSAIFHLNAQRQL